MNQLSLVSEWANELGDVDASAISPDSKVLITLHRHALGVWELPAGKLIGKHVADDPGCELNLDGIAVDFANRRIACWNGPDRPGDHFLRLVDLATGRTISTHSVRNVKSAAFSPSGSYIITGEWKLNDGVQPRVCVWSANAPGSKQLASFEGHRNSVDCVAVSPDGRLLATACFYRNYPRRDDLFIWDLEELKPRLRLDAPEGNIRGLSWSSDGNRLTVLYTSQITVLEMNGSGHTIETGGKLDSVSSCGTHAAFMHETREGGVRLQWFSIWDLMSIRSVAETVPWPIPEYRYFVAFQNLSPNGQLLMSTDHKTHRLWDVLSGLPLTQLDVIPIAFSPNSDLILATRERRLALLRCPTDDEKERMLVEPRRVEQDMQQQRAERALRTKEEERIREEKHRTEEEEQRICREAEEKRRAKEEQERIRKQDEEKAEERIESARLDRILTGRKSNRQCIMCGSALGLVDRLLGKDRHNRCAAFKE